MNHTENFNRIMEKNKPMKKQKQQQVKVEFVGARENMNALQTDLSKCTIAGNVVSLPFERLPNYDQVRTALLNAGAQYKRSTFVFPNDARPYIDRLMGGESVNIKKEFQFFATPQKLADRLVELSAIEKQHTILEPSAGQGAIINAFLRIYPWKIYYCELMDINRDILSKIPNISNATNHAGNDFLQLQGFENAFDRIVANPPFNKNQDIDHIRKMWECLKPGGRIVTIASNSWRTGSQKKQVAFRDWLESVSAHIQEIERGEFQESGTMVSACILIIDKPAERND